VRDILPSEIVDALRDRYLAGVADAEAGFASARADEDSLTGALGQALSRRPEMKFSSGNADYAVKVDWVKLRGRGLNAPEKLYGPDGIFQIEIIDEWGQVIRRKALPFQAKTNWKGTNPALAKQCRDINKSLGSGIVVNFTANGYEVCSTKAAAQRAGRHGLVKEAGLLKPLGQLLGNEFLDCTVGRIGLFYDPDAEQFIGEDGNPLEPANAITTVIRRGSR